MPFGNCYGPGAIATARAFSFKNSNPKKRAMATAIATVSALSFKNFNSEKEKLLQQSRFLDKLQHLCLLGKKVHFNYSNCVFFGNCTLFCLGGDFRFVHQQHKGGAEASIEPGILMD